MPSLQGVKFPHCRCGKVWSPTREAAERAFEFITDYTHQADAVAYYECRQGGWHWTRNLNGPDIVKDTA